jgi:hypothetical protein
MGRFTLLPGSMLPLSWFACTPESPSRILERVWLAFSPFAPGLTRAIGSSNPGPRGICRQAPRTSSPVLGRHLSGLPHHALLRQKVRPTLLSYEAPRITPLPFSISKRKNPIFHLAFGQAFDRRSHVDRRSRLQGLATLWTVSASSPSEASFSSPHSWVSLFRAFS